MRGGLPLIVRCNPSSLKLDFESNNQLAVAGVDVAHKSPLFELSHKVAHVIDFSIVMIADFSNAPLVHRLLDEVPVGHHVVGIIKDVPASQNPFIDNELNCIELIKVNILNDDAHAAATSELVSLAVSIRVGDGIAELLDKLVHSGVQDLLHLVVLGLNQLAQVVCIHFQHSLSISNFSTRHNRLINIIGFFTSFVKF